jgi:hypothetical protein
MPFLLAAAHLHAGRPALHTKCKDLRRLSVTLDVFLPDGKDQTEVHV